MQAFMVRVIALEEMGRAGAFAFGRAPDRSEEATVIELPVNAARRTDGHGCRRTLAAAVLGRDDDLAAGMVPGHLGDRFRGTAQRMHGRDHHLDVGLE
jgi:hypothetical protein